MGRFGPLRVQAFYGQKNRRFAAEALGEDCDTCDRPITV
jgi:hypothetical protein